MEGLSKVSKGQNTDDIDQLDESRDLSPFIRVSIKSKKSKRSFTHRAQIQPQAPFIKQTRSPLRQESKPRLTQIFFKDSQIPRNISPITQNSSRKILRKSSPRPSQPFLSGLSKSYKKLTRLYIRNHEIFTLIQNRRKVTKEV